MRFVTHFKEEEIVKKNLNGTRLMATLGLTLALVQPVLAATSFSGLGLLPGYLQGYSSAISADGSVIVGYGEGFNPEINGTITEAFRWTQASGLQSLGFLPQSNSFRSTRAVDVSSNGLVIVGSGRSAADVEQAYRWTQATGNVGIGDLPGSRFSSSAAGVSADGSVIVGSGSSSNGDEAFRWTSNGMVGLGGLSGGQAITNGAPLSWAGGVSDDGRVVIGGANFQDGTLLQSQPFRWTAENGMVGLGSLPGGSTSYGGSASAISGDGSTIVGYSQSILGSEIFRWTAETGMVGLGVVGSPLATSFDGSVIVGDYTNTAGGLNFTEGFVWDEVNGLRSISEIIIGEGIDVTGWASLGSITGVSADGLTITGVGSKLDGGFVTPGHSPAAHAEPWVMHFASAPVPEPSDALMLLAGLSLIICRCRKGNSQRGMQ